MLQNALSKTIRERSSGTLRVRVIFLLNTFPECFILAPVGGEGFKTIMMATDTVWS